MRSTALHLHLHQLGAGRRGEGPHAPAELMLSASSVAWLETGILPSFAPFSLSLLWEEREKKGTIMATDKLAIEFHREGPCN